MTEQYKRTVIIITIALSMALPWVLLPLPISYGTSSVLLHGAALIGYMGITLLLWMYILGTRAVTGLIFSDIAPVLSIHKWLGKFAVPMIFFHPALISISYGGTTLIDLVLQVNTPIGRQILFGQIALLLLAFTWGVSVFLRAKIAFRPWKYLHYLAYLCVPFALLHVPNLGTNQQTSELVNGYYLTLVAIFALFTLIRARSLLNLDKATYVVADVNYPTPEDMIISVRPQHKSIKTPLSGQFAYIKLGFISEDHPFTVLWHNKKTDELTLGIRKTGAYTKKLHTLNVSDSVYISGPYGSFTSGIKTSGLSPIFIAGGIGITPFVRHLHANPKSQLFYANRTKDTALLYPELRELLKSNLHAYFERKSDANKPNEYSGYISAEQVRSAVAKFDDRQFYICGPAAMINALTKDLQSLGIKPEQVHSEEFGW